MRNAKKLGKLGRGEEGGAVKLLMENKLPILLERLSVQPPRGTGKGAHVTCWMGGELGPCFHGGGGGMGKTVRNNKKRI